MKPVKVLLAVGALLILDGAVSPARAAWNNVFQVCCHKHGRTATSFYAGNPCPPQPVCTTQYVQRCYYQPVTRYETRTYYEPVTTYQTSYYYEPVTSYRYSCYYDPCTCSYQQVAVPTTSYRLRAQNCPVQSWVQRCMSVPVTGYQTAFYWEPVTTCCTTTVGAPIPATGAPPPAAGPPMGAPTLPPTPGINEQRLAPTPGVNEQPGRGNGATIDRYYAPDTMPPASGSSHRPGQPTPQSAPPAPVRVRMDRIVALPETNVEGRVYRGGAAPQAGARLLFVSTAQQGVRQTAATDAAGQFRVTLGAGEWLVYVHGADGRPVFHSKLEVRPNERRSVTLVSR